MSVNSTRLRRRVERYLAANNGGRRQSGETILSRDATGDPAAIPTWRKGRELGEPILQKLDKYLSARGY